MKNKEIILGFVLLVSILGIGFVCAEKIGIDGVKDSYLPGEDIKIKITLYDNNTNKIPGIVDYKILNFYSDTLSSGSVTSGGEVTYTLSLDVYQGVGEVIVSYKDVEQNEKFNVGELKKADIRLEGDTLILKNVGNSVYEKKILIYIGSEDQTADVTLEVGQEKRIRLTAPDGDYDVKVIEGNEEQTLEFSDVHLTGNVVGLERVLGGANTFWQKYPVVALFLGALVLVIVVVAGLKVYNRYSNH